MKHLKKFLLFFCCQIIIFGLVAQNVNMINVQGHRGARGFYPENSIYGFCKAIEMGVHTIELDVVVSKDAQIVVSHDPYLNSAICKGPQGEAIAKGKEKTYNLFQMSYEEIEKCDCGSNGNSNFPEQVKMKSVKPTLEETFSRIEYFIEQNQLQEVAYNIEIKSSKKGDDSFHPKPEVFVELVVKLIEKYGLENRTYIQSFDGRVLEVVHKNYPNLRTSLLVGLSLSPIRTLKRLSFIPNYLSPNYRLVNAGLVTYCKENGIQLVPWTVNNPSDIKNMLDLGVDGIISDFPNRVIELL